MLAELPPLAPEWAPYEEPFHDIARVVMLATGFVLVPVEVPGPDLARALAQWLSEAGFPASVIDLIGEGEWQKLAGSLLHQAPSPGGAVMVIGRASLPAGAARALGLVNQARDRIAKQLKRPLLWCGPRSFLNFTWSNAPDFWSVRAVDHSIKPVTIPADRTPLAGQPVGAFPFPAARPASTPPQPPPHAAPPPPGAGIAGGGPPPAAPPVLAASAAAPAPPAAGPFTSIAVSQGDARSAAILAARDAEAALRRGDPESALRTVDLHLGLLGPGGGDIRARLAVLRVAALSRLGRDEEAAAELDALFLSPDSSTPSIQVDAFLEYGHLALRRGDVEGAASAFSAAKRLAARVGSPEKEVLARVGLGRVAMQQGHVREAQQMIEQGVIAAEPLGDEALLQTAREALGDVMDRAYDSKSAHDLTGQPLISQSRIHKVFGAAMRAGCARDALLAGIPSPIVASLPLHATPDQQLLSDLYELNRTRKGAEGAPPLSTWLRNAVSLTAGRPESMVFQTALSRLGASWPRLPVPEPRIAYDEAERSAARVTEHEESAPAPAARDSWVDDTTGDSMDLAMTPAEPMPAISKKSAEEAQGVSPEGAAGGPVPQRAARLAGRVPLTVLLHAPADKGQAHHLLFHITPLLRAGLTRWWSPDELPPGADRLREIERHLRIADVVIVLLSPDFIQSGEGALLERVRPRPRQIIPVLLRPTILDGTLFEDMELWPHGGATLSGARDVESTLTLVATELRALYEEL